MLTPLPVCCTRAVFRDSALLSEEDGERLLQWYRQLPRPKAKGVPAPHLDPHIEWECVWRVSRDGTDLRALQEQKLAGQRDTFIVCTTANGSLFGGFTPLERPHSVSDFERPVTDPSARSFVFSLRNPHGHPPRLFQLKASYHVAVGFGRDALVWGGGDTGESGKELCTRLTLFIPCPPARSA
jgi:hypothetical protein